MNTYTPIVTSRRFFVAIGILALFPFTTSIYHLSDEWRTFHCLSHFWGAVKGSASAALQSLLLALIAVSVIASLTELLYRLYATIKGFTSEQ